MCGHALPGQKNKAIKHYQKVVKGRQLLLWRKQSVVNQIIVGRGATASIHDIFDLNHPPRHTFRLILKQQSATAKRAFEEVGHYT